MKNRAITDLGLRRILRGLTQLEVAHAVGISPVNLCRYERGARRAKPEVVKRIEAAIEKLAKA